MDVYTWVIRKEGVKMGRFWSFHQEESRAGLWGESSSHVNKSRRRRKVNFKYLHQTGERGEAELRVSEDLWGPVTMYVKLPSNLTCHQCIIQVSSSSR